LLVFLLARLITAAQQDHNDVAPDRGIDSITFANTDPKLADTTADRFVIAEIAVLNTSDSSGDRDPGTLIAQLPEPLLECCGADDLRNRSVS